jgi:hypothetical protein
VFLQNNENKQQLFRLMFRVWLSMEASNRIAGKNRIFIVDGIAHQLTSDGISVNKQEIPEIDTSMWLSDPLIVILSSLLCIMRTG